MITLLIKADLLSKVFQEGFDGALRALKKPMTQVHKKLFAIKEMQLFDVSRSWIKVWL